MFHNTAKGAGASALVYSISETAKLNNLRPYYFRHILTELPKYRDKKGNIDPAKLDHLMPWAEELPEECRKPRRLNITVRQSRQSGVARATCPD